MKLYCIEAENNENLRRHDKLTVQKAVNRVMLTNTHISTEACQCAKLYFIITIKGG